MTNWNLPSKNEANSTARGFHFHPERRKFLEWLHHSSVSLKALSASVHCARLVSDLLRVLDRWGLVYYDINTKGSVFVTNLTLPTAKIPTSGCIQSQALKIQNFSVEAVSRSILISLRESYVRLFINVTGIDTTRRTVYDDARMIMA
eukprot:g35196.t1